MIMRADKDHFIFYVYSVYMSDKACAARCTLHEVLQTSFHSHNEERCAHHCKDNKT